MAELYPLPLGHLLKRIHHEYRRHKAVFDLPARTFYKGNPKVDTSVWFHDMPAATALGPAAGPQDQLVQNIVLSWLGGSRIFELKTVQILDELKIPRPCIDATNIGFNVEWSQELKLQVSLEEYVKSSMVIDILKASNFLELGETGPYIFDMSVGYDLQGISSEPVRQWIQTMLDATPLIDRFRAEIPDEWKAYRDIDFRTRIANSITLSTFHGCPPDEIEKIVHFLLTEIGVHSIIKLNPTQLGKARLEHVLHEVMGYRHLEVNQKAYAAGLTLEEAVDILKRLEPFARERNLGLGVKFSNTLETMNRSKSWFKTDDVMYMSGPPLHVIATTLVGEFRKLVGMRFPVTFSAGIDQFNFHHSVALGLCPITTCTDLLKPQGYARQSKYLKKLEDEMIKRGVSCVDDYLVKYGSRADQAIDHALDQLRHAVAGDQNWLPFQWGPLYQAPASNAPRLDEADEAVLANLSVRLKATADYGAEIRNTTTGSDRLQRGLRHLHPALGRAAAFFNTADYVDAVQKDPRYYYDQNKAVPKKIGSYLYLMDCISCDKCVPVCPNDANFIYEIAAVTVEYRNWRLHKGELVAAEAGVFKIERPHQIANFADFCNECGNCDIFCPEYGGPYIEKPRFFSQLATWQRHNDRDGFYAERAEGEERIWGRIEMKEYSLTRTADEARFDDGAIVVRLKRDDRSLLGQTVKDGAADGHVVDMKQYLRMDNLLTGVLNPSRVHYGNAHYLSPEAVPVES